jgi:hypothetical protein
MLTKPEYDGRLSIHDDDPFVSLRHRSTFTGASAAPGA